MVNNNLYIHIGPPKTATTAFQKFFINNSIDEMQYAGIVQPRMSDDDSFCKNLYRASCGNEVADSLKIDFSERITICSEEMFLVDSKNLVWQSKIKRLYELTSEQNPKIIIVLREPIAAIRSYYQELYFSLDKKLVPTINEFANSNYCKIYDYDYLLSFLNEVGFSDTIILDFKKLVNENYKVSDIFDVKCQSKVILKRVNESLKKRNAHYANNPSSRKLLSDLIPVKFKDNKLLIPIKRLLSYIVPDFKISKSKKIDIRIDHEIISKFAKSYKKIKTGMRQ